LNPIAPSRLWRPGFPRVGKLSVAVFVMVAVTQSQPIQAILGKKRLFICRWHLRATGDGNPVEGSLKGVAARHFGNLR